MNGLLIGLLLAFLLAGVHAGQPEPLTLEPVLTIAPPADLYMRGLRAFWSRDSSAILAKYTSSEGTQFIVYDTVSGSASEPLTLAERLRYPLAWQPQGGEGTLWAREGEQVALVEDGTLSVFLSAQHIPDEPDLVVPHVYWAAWSADGRYLAWPRGSGLQVWDFQANEASMSLPQLDSNRFTWFGGYPSFAVPERVGIENRAIVPYDAATGEPYGPLLAPEEWTGGLRRIWWSPDGTVLFSEIGYQGINDWPPPVVWNTETGEVIDLGVPDAYYWDWHPNSRWLAYLELNMYLIGVLDINEGRVIERILAKTSFTAFRWSPDGNALFTIEEAGGITVYRTG